MKKLVVFIFYFLSHFIVNAQVANDSCLSAIDLGTIDYPWNGGMNCPTFVPMDTVIYVATTSGAQPNFPYPANPNGCNGYTTTLAIPANDVWYKLRDITGCNLEVGFAAIDTLHVSLWAGDTCSYLAPFDCFTIPAGTTVYETIPFGYLTSVYLQISGNGLGKFVGFTMCIRSSAVQCSFGFANNIPTPVNCFYYETSLTNASSNVSIDGSATVNMIYGTPPYSILWNDGNINWTRANLAVGNYYFTVTDGNGCQETDSIVISTTSGGMLNNERDFALKITPNPAHEKLIVKIESKEVKFNKANFVLRFYDLSGKEVLVKVIKGNDELIIMKNELLPGFYSSQLSFDGVQVETDKIVIF